MHPRVLAEKLVRQLQKHARAVSGVGVGPRTAAMRKAYQNFQCVFDNRVRALPVHMRDETCSAGIMLKFRPPERCFVHRSRFLPRTLSIRRDRRFVILGALLSNLLLILLLLSHVSPCRIFRLCQPFPNPFLPCLFFTPVSATSRFAPCSACPA